MLKKSTKERNSAIKNSIWRIILIALLVVVQILAFVIFVLNLGAKYPMFAVVMRALALATVLGINAHDRNGVLKLLWVIIILTFPIAGLTLFLIIRYNPYLPGMRRRMHSKETEVASALVFDDDNYRKVREECIPGFIQAEYLRKNKFPLYKDTEVKYFAEASHCYKQMIEDIAAAKDYVYLEYHAIENSTAFEPLHKVLKEKAASGVDCRVIYDDVGSFVFVNRDFMELLNSEGIKCNIFNPALPILSIFMNNRDHRKICVIDGKVGYTGGFNIADEYFNITHPYGRWKDTGVRLEGLAVDSLKAMFIEMWNFTDFKSGENDFLKFSPSAKPKTSEGLVLPYCDNPIDDELVGENVYINALNGAIDYCWFMSPYLVLSDELKRAFILAAARGVDVRILTPGIPDKKTVYGVTRSYYKDLCRAGVKIYEYTPGFNHSKMFIADGKVSVVGTINLDFRSLYYHFENAVLFIGGDIQKDIYKDFEESFAKSENVTEKACKEGGLLIRFAKSILRLVAPLL